MIFKKDHTPNLYWLHKKYTLSWLYHDSSKAISPLDEWIITFSSVPKVQKCNVGIIHCDNLVK